MKSYKLEKQFDFVFLLVSMRWFTILSCSLLFIKTIPCVMSQNQIDTSNLPQLSGSYAGMQFVEQGDLTVFIDLDNEVYLENKRIKFWDDLMPTARLGISTHSSTSTVGPKIIFHVHKKVKYWLIDQIKEELSRLQFRAYGYLFSNAGTPNLILDRNIETTQRKWRGPIPAPDKVAYFFVGAPISKQNPIKISKEESELYSSPRLKYRLQIAERLYVAENTTEIDSILPFGKTIGITILPDRKVKFQGKILSFDALEGLQGMLKKGYLVLYTFSNNLDYEDYIFFLGKKSELVQKQSDQQHTYGAFLEVSGSLAKRLATLGYDFFSQE